MVYHKAGKVPWEKKKRRTIHKTMGIISFFILTIYYDYLYRQRNSWEMRSSVLFLCCLSIILFSLQVYNYSTFPVIFDRFVFIY